eukprot:scaffold35646_cov59-Attheya_sp.AAC.1
MSPVGKAVMKQKLGHEDKITLSEGVCTGNIHVFDRGAMSNGVAMPLDILAWTNNMTEQTAMITARTAMLEQHVDIATKCRICLEAKNAQTLHCGHHFCV